MISQNPQQFTPAEREPRAIAHSRHIDLFLREGTFTWEQALRVLRKHLKFTAAFCCVIVGLILLYLVMQKNYYRPVARLEIAPPGGGINTLHEIETPPETNNQDYLETQVQILQSDALAIAVIRDLHLDQDGEFVPAKTRMESIAKQQQQNTLPTQTQKEAAIFKEQLDLANLTLAESTALEQFRKSLSVGSVRNTRLVELSFSSQDPRLAQVITNSLVMRFIDQNYKHQYNTTMQASDWLSSQLNDLRGKVDESNQAVARYQKEKGLVEQDDHDVPMSQLMSEVNRQLSDAQASRIETESLVRMVDAGHAESGPALKDDKVYQDLMTRYMDLRAQLAQSRAVYGDANVNVRKLLDQLTEVSVQIDAERKRVVARLRSNYESEKQREALMIQERDKLRDKMAYMTSELAAYHVLKTEANANVELYNTLQGRLREAGIYAGLQSSNIRVVDLAQNLKKPSGPHRAVLFALGTFGTCFAAVVLCFLREGLRNTVRTPEDVRSWIGLPSLALLPAIDAEHRVLPAAEGWSTSSDPWEMPEVKVVKQNEVEIMRASTTESEAMRDLRTALFHGRKENTPRVILISSSVEGEGKTTVAVNFAIALAQLGPTCLVEADLRQPDIARVFKLESAPGLVDVLQSSESLSDAVVNVPNVDNLAILPCGTRCASPADILSSDRMIPLLNTLKEYFSFIVIDSPPVIPFSDARFLSCLSDEVVLVGRYGVTTRRCLQRAVELLGEVHASVAGVVLNAIDLSSPDYDYYTYGYNKWKARRKRDALPKVWESTDHNDPDKPGAMGVHA
jgi:polysaccharide biosynthesis transport protein